MRRGKNACISGTTRVNKRLLTLINQEFPSCATLMVIMERDALDIKIEIEIIVSLY